MIEVVLNPRLATEGAGYGQEVSVFAAAFHVNVGLTVGERLDPDEVARAFEAVGHCPRLLEAAVTAHVAGKPGPGSAPSTLMGQAAAARAASWSDLDAIGEGLPPVQRAVIARVATEGHASGGVHADDAYVALGRRPHDADPRRLPASISAYSAILCW